MANIALVSVTLNAVNPMTDYFRSQSPNWKIRNYLDSYLLEKVKLEGGINDSSVKRMFDMLCTACEDGADVVLMTCTIFSPYAEHFSKILSIPIICPDQAMLENVAAQSGKKAILCTFTGTVEITKKQYISCCHKTGRNDEVDMIVLPEAYQAANIGDFQTHDRIIREKAIVLDKTYDHLVFAQISMARAAEGLNLNHAAIYTSPSGAYETVNKLLKPL